MRILQVSPTYPPAYSYGGITPVVERLSKELELHGHNVSVCTTDSYNAKERVGHYSNPEIDDGVLVYRFRNLSNTLATKGIYTPINSVKFLVENMDDFDIVHVHDFRTMLTLFSYMGSLNTNIPFILQPHGSIPKKDKRKLKDFVDFLFGEKVISQSQALIATSHSESDLYNKNFSSLDQEKIVHIPNGIDFEKYNNKPSNYSFRENFHICENSDIVLYLGRIHSRKGIDLLMKAFSELEQDGEKELVIAGPDGGCKDDLVSLASELGVENEVTFTGYLSKEQKFAAYKEASVFVLPSFDRYESFGNVVLEALACGTPVVVTNVSGVSEWLSMDWVRVVSPTSEEIMEGIDDIFESQRSTFDEIDTKLRESFSWNSVSQLYEDVYGSLM